MSRLKFRVIGGLLLFGFAGEAPGLHYAADTNKRLVSHAKKFLLNFSKTFLGQARAARWPEFFLNVWSFGPGPELFFLEAFGVGLPESKPVALEAEMLGVEI